MIEFLVVTAAIGIIAFIAIKVVEKMPTTAA
jgi:Tfp pilus assembly major pilin PilA